MAGEFTISRRSAMALGAGGLLIASRPAWAFQTAPSPYDAIVERFMAEFEMPGIGIAVVRPGQAPFTRGYGVRRIGRPERVDTDTLFAIASNS
ncbi:MAG TPA: serine hydrolase, partial [Allosphingosinicella sp.]